MKCLQSVSRSSNLIATKINESIVTLAKALTESRINFDNLPDLTSNTKWIPNHYRGLRWTNISYMNQSCAVDRYPRSGYVTAFISGSSSYIAFFNEEASITVENPNETFTISSVSACAAWNDDLQLTIKGYQNSREMNRHTATLLFGKLQFILLRWNNVDKITFKPSGGTAHSGSGRNANLHVVLTQITIGAPS